MTAEKLSLIGYTIYRPDGTEERGEVEWPESPGLKLIHHLIDPIVGGDAEHVLVLDPAKVGQYEVDPVADRRDLFVDEAGHMREPPSPRNENATAIYRANWLRGHPGTDPETLPFIAGVAVLFDQIVWQ